MRYCKLSWIEFYFCYLQQCLSIDIFPYWIPSNGQKYLRNKVCPSVRKFSWHLVFSFVWNSAWCLGPIWCCDRAGFLWKIYFFSKNGESRPSLRFFECIWKFSYNFFSIWSIINFGSWDMCQNIPGQSDCRSFKSAISLEENDEKMIFLHVDRNSLKLKVVWKILGWAWS